jgi:methyltransferase (TIGR00027 family)
VAEAKESQAIRNISDTARWVAYYRAMETARPDAIFHDPYAKALAGERGEHIARTLRGGLRNSWSMIVRTAIFDEILLRILAGDQIDLVVNLAAGLDTRPYRLDLPASLHWMEVDLPEMIDYKTQMLAREKPKCRLDRVALDLADQEGRRDLFERLDSSAGRVFLITEGLLAYLEPNEVGSLATDLLAANHFEYWLTEIASPRVKQMMDKHWGKQLKAANAPIKFAPAEGDEFFRPFGWNPVEFRGFLEESERLNRTMPMMWIIRAQMRLFPRRTAKRMKVWRSGVVLLRRV